MGINIGSSFTQNAALPLDDRETVATSTARNAIPAGKRWQGMQVYVVADQVTYYLKTGVTNSDWAVLGSGGSTVSDATFAIQDATDATKQINFDAAGTTGTKTTIAGSQTTNRTVTLPDATDTLVGKATTDTLTNKTISGASNTLTNIPAGSMTGQVPIANGGTGQATQQTAINALTGTQSAGKYLRSDGTNAALATIVAADVPTLNQNTTGTAASFTGSLVGDVTGTQGATVVSQVGGATAANVATTVTSVTNATSAATASTLMKRDANANVQVNNIAESFTSTVTAVASTVLTAASSPIQQFTGTTIQVVQLPATNASGMSLGMQFQILNRSTGALTVVNGSGTGIQTVAPGGQLIATAATSGSPGTWDLSYSITGTLPIASGGTGATTQQAAMNALAGTQSSGKYLRSDGTNTTLSTIVAADVPTLNQNTTGSAASFTGSLAGDVTGTQGATSINATSAATASTVMKRDSNINVQVNNISESFTSTTTVAGTTTLTAASTGIQQFTGTNTQTVSLPATNASGMSLGMQFQIFNRSTGAVTVKDSAATILQVIAAGAQLIVTAATSGSPGTWDLTYTLNGSTAPVSSGAKNYLTQYVASQSSGTANPGNGDAELGTTTGWELGLTGTLTNGLPTGAPTFGAGASGNLSFSSVSSGQLAGKYSFSYASSAATTVGNMVSSKAFYIDTEDQSQVLTFKFAYSPTSGSSNCNWSGTSSNSFGVAVYDIFNSSWIPVTGAFGMTQGSGVGICTGTFQTNANTTQLRVCIYNINATAGAMTLLLDDLSVGPQTIVQGTPVTSWQSYTPTITGSTTNPTRGSGYTENAQWRRVGDSMEIMYSYIQTVAGSAGSGTYAWSLPAGYSIDTTKTNLGSSISAYGPAQAWDLTNGKSIVGVINGASTTTLSIEGIFVTGTTTTSIPTDAGSASVSFGVTSVRFTFSARVPIVGWSSNVQMSNDTDTRVITYFASGAPTNTISSTAQTVTIPTISDNTGSVSGGIFTAPISGYYPFSCTTGFGQTGAVTAGNIVALTAVKNGSTTIGLFQASFPVAGANGYQLPVSLNGGVQLNAGETLQFKISSQQTTNLIFNTPSTISINRLSGPSVIAASESVNASYQAATGVTIGTSPTTIAFTTKNYDSHSAWTGTQYNVGISGKFVMKVVMATASTTLTTTQNFQVQVVQAGSQSLTKGIDFVPGNGSATTYTASGSAGFYCLAGDTLTIQASCSVATTTGLSTGFNHFEIERIGN